MTCAHKVFHARRTAQTLAIAAWLAGAAVAAASGISPTPDHSFWQTGGSVYALAESDGILYVGGYFSVVGPNQPGAALIDASTDALATNFPGVGGAVRAVASDGNGGWFLGGYFDRVGNTARVNLAHVLADGSVDPAWHPDPDGLVTAMAYHAGSQTLYVAGLFTTIAGEPRARLAAVRADGTLSSWQPDPDWQVYTLALSPGGDKLYVGGYFTSIAGQARNYLAAFETAGGTLTSWDPGADNYVKCLQVSGDGATVYAGGRFQMVDGEVRQRLVAIAASTGHVTAFDSMTGGYATEVHALALADGKLYVAGSFTHIGGQDRYSLAALDPDTGAATAWDPGADSTAYSIAVCNGKVYAGGAFLSIGGEHREYFAVIDQATGMPAPNSLPTDGPVRILSAANGRVFAGGDFTTLGGHPRMNLAAIDLATGQATDFQCDADGYVDKLALSPDGGTLYAAGMFNTLGGQSRCNLAAVNLQTGQVTSWAPCPAGGMGFTGPVHAIAAAAETVYIAGEFDTIDSVSRPYLAAVSASTGTLLPWDPQPDGFVETVEIAGNRLLAGGSFAQMGGQARNRIAAVDLGTGLADDWNPDASQEVTFLKVLNGTLYASGSFSAIGEAARGQIAGIDLATGLPTSWDPGLDWRADAIATAGDTLIIGGDFTTFAGQSRSRLAAASASTGEPADWDPGASDRVYALAASDGLLCVGGAFGTIASRSHQGLAVFRVNRAPVAQGGSWTVQQGASVGGQLTATDADGDALTYEFVSGASNGEVILNGAAGSFAYTPSAGYVGADSFTYRVSDGSLYSSPATVTITVQAAPPPEIPPSYSLTVEASPLEGGSVTVSPAGPYTPGTVVNLVATPANGFAFTRWAGLSDSCSSNINVTVSADAAIQAVFVRASEAAETSVDLSGQALVTLETADGPPQAAISIAGAAPGAAVTAVLADSQAEPFESYAGFADGAALNRRLIIESDLPNGTFTALVEIYYREEELGGLDETQLRLFHWNEDLAHWEPAGTHDLGVSQPTQTAGDYGVDTAGNRVWAVVNHFSEFAAGKANVASALPQAPLPDEQVAGEEPELPPAACGACGAGAPFAAMLGGMALGLVRNRRRGR